MGSDEASQFAKAVFLAPNASAVHPVGGGTDVREVLGAAVQPEQTEQEGIAVEYLEHFSWEALEYVAKASAQCKYPGPLPEFGCGKVALHGIGEFRAFEQFPLFVNHACIVASKHVLRLPLQKIHLLLQFERVGPVIVAFAECYVFSAGGEQVEQEVEPAGWFVFNGDVVFAMV